MKRRVQYWNGRNISWRWVPCGVSRRSIVGIRHGIKRSLSAGRRRRGIPRSIAQVLWKRWGLQTHRRMSSQRLWDRIDTHRALWWALHLFVLSNVVLGYIVRMGVCFSVVTIVSRGFRSSKGHWIAFVALDGALVRIREWTERFILVELPVRI